MGESYRISSPQKPELRVGAGPPHGKDAYLASNHPNVTFLGPRQRAKTTANSNGSTKPRRHQDKSCDDVRKNNRKDGYKYPYEIGPELQEKQLEILERQYGGRR